MQDIKSAILRCELCAYIAQKRAEQRVLEERYNPYHDPKSGRFVSRNNRLPDILIGKTLGAKAKNYDVEDKASGEHFRFAEGSKIQNVQIFAGKNGAKPLDENVAEGLVEQIGGNADKWQHCKGIAMIDCGSEYRKAEVHWFQEETQGKHKFKIKRWLDD